MALSLPLTIREIYDEINGTSHGANAQIGSGVTMSSLRTSSIAYNNTGNVQAAPDVISEWNGYAHAQSMGTITYGVRLSTAQATWGLEQDSTDFQLGDTATANGGVTIWRTHDGSNTYIKAKRFGSGSNLTGRYHTGSSASNLTTSNSGQTLITIPVTDVTITATVHALVNTSVGYSGSPQSISVTGAALLVCRGAEEAEGGRGEEGRCCTKDGDERCSAWSELHQRRHAADKENTGGYHSFRVNTANDLPGLSLIHISEPTRLGMI